MVVAMWPYHTYFIQSGVDVSANDMSTINKILGLFPDIKQDAGCMRALAFTLHGWSLFDDTIKYAEQGLSMLTPGRSPIRYYLNISLYQALGALGKTAEALYTLEAALDSLPEEWKSDANLTASLKNVHIMKAYYLQGLDPPRPDEAVEAFKAAKATQPSHVIDGWLLEQTASVLCLTTDPTRSKLLALLKSWSQSELNAWFATIGDATWGLAFIATRCGEEGKDFVLRSFDGYMKSIPIRSDTIVVAQACLADMYWRTLNDPQEARKLYTNVLQRKIRNHDQPGVMEYVSTSRLNMSDIIFEEFRTTRDHIQKKALLTEIKQLASPKAGTKDWVFLQESSISVSVALMTRAIGSAIEYEGILQNAFESCVINLSDSVGWNDFETMRLLARILCCVGLDRDARISISCQFSIVTEEKTESPETPPTSSIERETESITIKESEKFTESVSSQVNIVESTAVGTCLEPDGKEMCIAVVEVEIETATTQELEASVANLNGTTTAAKEENIQAENTNAFALPEIEDEELAEGSWITCDGLCESAFTKYSEPIFLCIFCPSVDLCTKCHRIRQAQNAGEPSDWRSYCGKDHRYLKGPIQGWKGVKNGIIRIEGEDGNVEKIAFKEWLKGLKEERWVEAWEKFWRDSADVKDVVY
jgi:tetratricopeptide (TPR) repeat protein